MQKKGCLTLIKNDKIKCIYCHRNATYDSFGQSIVEMIKAYSIEELNALYDYIEMVDEDEPMTAEQKEAYKKYMPEKLWTPDLNWTTALKYTINPIKPLVDGFKYQVDYAGFAPSWRNRFRYIIDLDKNEFRVTKGGLELINQEFEEFIKVDYPDSISAALIGTFPLDNVPDNWKEVLKDNWNGMILRMVPADECCRNGQLGESDYAAQRTASKMEYFLGR